MTARFSTGVIPEGIETMIRGRMSGRRLRALVMKCFSICSAISKSAITPSFSGLMAVIDSGVLPSMCLASAPTAMIFRSPRSFSLTATTDGSSETIPFPFR
jgi:hypothetical protein